MKKYLLAMVLVFVGVYLLDGHCTTSRFKEGDIIFQTSKSEQSKYIRMATKSQLSHCGIVVEKGGRQYVLEASNVIKLTPVDDFIAKGVGKKYWVKRVVDKPVKIRYQHLLGRRYDSQFKWNNNLYYCSELVYHIYDSQLGIKLGKPRKVSSYWGVGLFKKYIKKRKIDMDELVISPKDIYDA